MLVLLANSVNSVVQLISVIVIFILVLAGTYFATRWVANFQKTKMDGSNIKVLETMRISNTKYLQIVKIGSKCFAIAVCKDTVTFLGDLKEEELVFDQVSAKSQSESFKAILDKFKKDKPEE